MHGDEQEAHIAEGKDKTNNPGYGNITFNTQLQETTYQEASQLVAGVHLATGFIDNGLIQSIFVTTQKNHENTILSE
ncbi:MAG: hypothetical protein ABF293_13655 [Flavobacteriaceae bacterium]